MWDEIIRLARNDNLILVGFWLMILGSIVDIWQFSMMARRWGRKQKRRLYEHIRRQVIVEEFEKRKRE